jgi:hypothetical protein
MRRCFAISLGVLACTILRTHADEQVNVVARPDTSGANSFYVGNRAPLAPSPLVKLPIGRITPKGWLRSMLELETRGMTGRLAEISPWLKFESNAWANKEGKGHSGWEELPYWLKGYGDLGYVLKDGAIVGEARKWIDAVLNSQTEDGWFGPRELQTNLAKKARDAGEKPLDGQKNPVGTPDMWPHMVMLNALQSYYEYSGDPRVLPFMTRYFKWQIGRPDSDFAAGYWPKIRAGDNIESVYWLYNRTGEAWLLDLAKKIHANMANWTGGVCDWHNVNVAQGFRAPAVYYMQAKERKFLDAAERNYQTVMGSYGQFPGGGFAGDENCRPGYGDPRQGFETCGIVEFMHSFEMLTKISGEPLWADRCEEIAFNSLPAAMTPDLKGLRYLTGANMVQLDRNNKSPGIQNAGQMLSYSPADYRCCQHNVSHGWPYYAEELWLATPDNGLCASLYAASEVVAKVGDGAEVTIAEETDYPFDDSIRLKVSAPRTVAFPLYLRIPRWSGNPVLAINGKAIPVKAGPLSYVVIRRPWADGDVVTVQLPMGVSVRSWPKNQNAVSVDYGPLTFSLKIGEKWTRYGGTDAWPQFEVFPTTPWNYGLVLDEKDPAGSFELIRRREPMPPQPFTTDAALIQLKAKGRRIPNWKLDGTGLLTVLQPSPVKSDEPLETITLVPMGAARLRISMFPTIGDGPQAKPWGSR